MLIGFIVNNYDPCVLQYGQWCPGVHDLLPTCTSNEVLDGVTAAIASKFAGVSAVRGHEHSYLAKHLDVWFFYALDLQ